MALAGHRGEEAEARSALTDSSPQVRATALGALARMEALTTGDLVSLVADPDPAVRRRAAEVVGRMRPSARICTPDLCSLLVDAEPEVVEMAAWALGERGDPGAVSHLASTARHHPDPLCREAAVAALGAISVGPPSRSADEMAPAGRTDEPVRAADAEALAAILDSLHDRPAVRRRAVLALAAFEGPEVTGALRAALTDKDWQVRQAAEDLLAT